jgi:large subunit ribosomal protein L24e
MPDPGPSSISSGSLLDLKAIAAEHVDRFEKEGRSAVRGQRNKRLTKVRSRSVSPTSDHSST